MKRNSWEGHKGDADAGLTTHSTRRLDSKSFMLISTHIGLDASCSARVNSGVSAPGKLDVFLQGESPC